MKLFATLTPLLLTAAVVDALSIWTGDKQALVLDDRVIIPGASPLQHCTPDHESDLLIIEHVNLSPNPPVAYVSPRPSARIHGPLLTSSQWQDPHHRGRRDFQ